MQLLAGVSQGWKRSQVSDSPPAKSPPPLLPTQPPEKQNPLTFRTEAFFWSLAIGAIASLITWFCLRLFRGDRK